MKERHLKVYESPVWERNIPQIRLQGKWLSSLGFSIGEEIMVSCEDGKLIIQLEPIVTSKDL